MSETQCWEIDRLAASRLLGRLKIKTTPAILEEVAAEFAEHRMGVESWTAGRVQSKIIRALEARSMRDFVQMDDNWADGFRTAEELVAKLSTNELLDQPSGSAQSKGQLLRSMVRGMRKRSALAEKHP